MSVNYGTIVVTCLLIWLCLILPYHIVSAGYPDITDNFSTDYTPFDRTLLGITYTDEVSIDDTDFTYTDDVTYNKDREDFLTFSSDRILTIPFNLSMSETGNTVVEHVMTLSSPSFAWIDSTENVIKIDTSKRQRDFRYSFDIITTVPPSTWPHTKSVSLMVLK